VPIVATALVFAACQLGALGLTGRGTETRALYAPDMAEIVAAQTAAHQGLVQWRSALAAANYRRDTPAVAALADTLTEALAQSWNDHPEARPALLDPLEQIAGRALGPIAEATPFALLPAWLRHWGDREMLVAPSHGLRAAEAIRPLNPARAAEYLREFTPVVSSHWSAWCGQLLTLPAALRAPLADRLAEESPRARDPIVRCQVVRALSPRLRPALVAELRDEGTPQPLRRPRFAYPHPVQPGGLRIPNLGHRPTWSAVHFTESVWPLVTAFALAGTPDAAFGLSLLRRGLAPDRITPSFWPTFGEALEGIIPSLEMTPEALGRALRAVVDEHENPAAFPLGYAMLSVGDAWPSAWALRVMRGPLGRENDLPAALLLAGTLTPDTPAARLALDDALGSLRAALGPYALRRITQGQIDLWREALPVVAACTNAPCLHQLLRDGSDEAAARAAVRLGPAGIAALPEATARAVVARVVETPGDTALAAVMLTRTRGCPEHLRGLVEYRRPLGLLPRDPRPPLLAWRERFARTCGPRSRP